MSNVEVTADRIVGEETKIEMLRWEIQDLYAEINSGLLASNGVITKEIEQKYKEIDAVFSKKTKHEQTVLTLKRQIFIDLGVL